MDASTTTTTTTAAAAATPSGKCAPPSAPPSALPRRVDHDPVLRPYAVYKQIGALIGLALLQSLSFGILAPMMTIIITEYFARQVTQGEAIDCGVNAHSEACAFGSKEAAWWSSVFSAIGCVLLFFLSPIIGQASDTYGRKIFVVLSQVFRVGVPFTIIWFAQLGGSIAPYFFLRFVDSAFGTSSVSSAQIADIVSPANRAAAFGILFAAFSIGYCVAAGLAPLFSRTHALYVASALFVLRVLWSVFILPETLPRDRRAAKPAKGIQNPLKAMAILFRSQMFVCLTSLIAVTAFVSNGFFHIIMYYLNTVVGFDEHAMSHLLLLSGVLSIVSQMLLLKPLMSCAKEKGVIVIALVANIVNCAGYVATAFYPARWIIFAVAVPSCVSELSFAAISSLKSVNVSVEEQGRLQGAIYGVRGIFEAAGPLVFAGIYSRMHEDSPVSRSLPFVLSIVLYGVCIGIALVMRVPVHTIAKPLPLVSPTVAATPSTMSIVFSTDDESDSHLFAFDSEVDDDVLAEPLLGQASVSDLSYPDVDV